MKMDKKGKKTFWKLLDKFKETRDNLFKGCIPGKNLSEHFKGILRDDSREIITLPTNLK